MLHIHHRLVDILDPKITSDTWASPHISPQLLSCTTVFVLPRLSLSLSRLHSAGDNSEILRNSERWRIRSGNKSAESKGKSQQVRCPGGQRANDTQACHTIHTVMVQLSAASGGIISALHHSAPANRELCGMLINPADQRQLCIPR